MTSFRSRLLLTVIAAVGLTAACSINIDIGDDSIEGSGDVETRSYELRDFEQLDVSSAFVVDVTVVPGGDYQVDVSADDNLFDELVIEVDGDKLEIGVASGSAVRTDNPLSATVTMPTLSAIEASGASNVTVNAGSTTIQDLAASGASTVRVAELNGNDITIDSSGASRVDLSGVGAEKVNVDASGASRVDLTDFPIEEGDVRASGASVVEFGPANEVEGDASGASSVRVEQSTIVDVDTSGGSTVDRS